MRLAVTGSTGLVGSALVESLAADGHEVLRLLRPASRAPAGPGTAVRWNPTAGELDRAALEAADAVVHLAGASIADGRWNGRRKELLISSRVDTARHLIGELATLSQKPKAFVSASAIGIYGDRGEEILSEESVPGSDFLGRLAQAWEAEAARAEEHGIRAVMLRFGIILSPKGGALGKMLTPFKLGVGGRLGSGRQWMSWITLADTVRVIRAAIESPDLRGPVNTVAPNPVTNADFTRALAQALHRPAIFPAPAFALRLMLGEMADALLLSSQRVAPKRLENLGHRFQHPELGPALRAVLGGGE